MEKPIVSDDLWAFIEPLLPVRPATRKVGRPRIDDHAVLTGILFVLKTGIPWECLPPEMGCGTGMTCWRRLRDWQQAGVWQCIHDAMLLHLRKYDQIEWERASIDSASVPSPLGGRDTGRNPTDRGKLGCKHHLIVDGCGLPLVTRISGAQVHDSRMLVPMVAALPSVAGLTGHPRKRPDKLHGDKSYDYPVYRRWLRKMGIAPRIARRGIESRERLGRWRWVFERTLSWLHRFRRLRIRFERRADLHQAFLSLGGALIC